MNETIVTDFLDALVSHKLVDKTFYKEGRGALVISEKVIPFSVKEKGFAVGGDSPVECYCPNPAASLVRVLSCQLFGTTDAKFKDHVYSSVNMYPKAIRSDGVLFATANGKEFLASSSNSRVTLGLYDLLYSRNADSSILMMPELIPSKDVVSIANHKAAKYFVFPKNSVLSSSLTAVTDEVIVTGADTEKAKQINNIYSDKSILGNNAPANADLVEVSSQCILSSTKNGYTLSSQLSLDNGITYHLEEEIKPEFSLVQSSVLAANALLSDLDKGVIFSAKHKQALKNMRYQPKAVSVESSLSIAKEVASSGKTVSEFWGIPVYSHRVTSYVWSY